MADMKKQHIARHNAMMRMLIKGFTEGAKGRHYLIADIGTVDTLKDIGVHSKRVPKFMLPDSYSQHTTQHMKSCGNHLTCRVGDVRKRMRPDMMVVEMTDTEQHTYLQHDTVTGSRLPNLQSPPFLAPKQGSCTIRQWKKGWAAAQGCHNPYDHCCQKGYATAGDCYSQPCC